MSNSRETSAGPWVAALRGVGKRYGRHWAIRNVHMTLKAGEILGFIGPNGAGKTSLLRVLAGLTQATEGEVEILGERLDGRPPRSPEGLGLVPEQVGFIPYLSGRKNLEMLARLRGVAGAEAIQEALERVGLDPQDRRPVRTYSLGMRQRLCVAQALMERPRLLLLDEPTNGLDPSGILLLRQLLRQLAQQGTAIFMASHLLTELERICDRVLLVRQGQIVKEVIPNSNSQARMKVRVTSAADGDALAAWGARAGWPMQQLAEEQGMPVFLLTVDRPVPQMIKELVEAGVSLEEFVSARQSLEDAFIETLELSSKG